MLNALIDYAVGESITIRVNLTLPTSLFSLICIHVAHEHSIQSTVTFGMK